MTPVESIPEAVSAPRRKMSFEEFLEWADDGAHVEWVDGEIVEMSPISKPHQRTALFLLNLISAYVMKKRLGEIFFDPFVMKTGPHLPGRAPDLLFVSNEHQERLKENYLDGPADLAVEIVSPESGRRDRGEKFDEYETGGVREYWLIDPIRKSANFYQRGEDGFYHSASLDDEGRYHSAVLEGFWLKPDWLWLDPLLVAHEILQENGML